MGTTTLNALKQERKKLQEEKRAAEAATNSSAPMTEEEKKVEALKQVEARKGLTQEPESAHAGFPLRLGRFRRTDGEVAANYFDISIDPDTDFYEYEILGLPPGRDRETLRPLLDATIDRVGFLRQNKGIFATDHISTIISWKSIHTGVKTKEQDSEWGPFNIPDGRNHDGTQRTRQLSIRLIRKLDFGALRKHTEAKEGFQQLWKSSSEVKALNILISSCFDTSKVVQVGANKFFVIHSKQPLATDPGPRKTALCTMEGFFYTIKPTRRGISLNVNTATSAFYSEMLLSDYLADLKTFATENQKRAAMKGLRVQITYRRGAGAQTNKLLDSDEEGRKKTIQSWSEKGINEVTFSKTDKDTGQQTNVTVKEYLESTYKHVFNDVTAELPAINLSTTHGETWYSATHLKILPNQVYRRPVPDALTDVMLNKACRPPQDNKERLETELFDFLELSHRPPGNNSPVPFKRCPVLRIVPRLVSTPMTRLDLPQILYRDARPENKKGLSKWVRNKTTKYINSGDSGKAPIQCYLFVAPGLQFPASTNDNATPTRCARELKSHLKDYGIGDNTSMHRDAEVHMVPLQSLEIIDLRRELLTVKWLNNFPEKSKIVALLLPRRDISTYQKFKDLTDREFGLRSMCLTETRICATENLNPYFGNVMLKTNLKFGGSNHTTHLVTEKLKDRLMILGADVTHPGSGAIEGCPSIAAIVGSVGDSGGKYLGSLRLQDQDKKDREIIDGVRSMVVERLHDWTKARGDHKELPRNIIYYRDGVSEGQYDKVKVAELEEIRAAYREVAKGMGLKQDFALTAIVVTKRHHTRFYPKDPNDDEQVDGKDRNCRPGTLVEQDVTSPYFIDFFLQSHSGLQGTTKPAHYFVLENQMGWTPDELQDFTHQICYTYARAMLGVSYASPAYYADRLCERGRAYIRDFLIGDEGLRKALQGQKSAWETERRNMRNSIFPRSRDAQGHRPRKTSDEEIMASIHRDQVAKLCRQHTMQAVGEIWERHGGKDKNPWNSHLDNTMFWM
jgi:eukaryotic translation initiation factor 2C